MAEGGEAALAFQQLNLEQWYAIVWVIQGNLLDKTWAEVNQNVVNCLVKANQKHGSKRVSK